jgi:FSR family fosmidomycin resistance protein-like MFS transporter
LRASAARPAGEWNLRALSLVAFAHGVGDFFAGMIPLVIYFVIARDHLSPAYQGLLGLLWYFTSSLVQPFFGAYADRNGRWWFLPGAIVLTVTSLSLVGSVHSLPLLALCIIAGGLGSAIMHPEAGKYSAMLSGMRKAGGISIFQIGGQIGFSLGPVAIAPLLAHFGGAGTLYLLPPMLAVAFAIFFAMPRVDRAAYGGERPVAVVHASSEPADRLGVSLLIASTALRHFVSAAFMTFLPNVLAARGYTLTQSGELVSAFLMVSAIGLYAGGAFADRFGSLRVCVASLCAAVPLLASFFAVPGALGIALLLGGSVLLSMQNAPGVALVQAMLPRNLGMALGLMNGVAFGVGSMLVALTGFIGVRIGFDAALAQASYVPLLAALSMLAAGKRSAEMKAQARSPR